MPNISFGLALPAASRAERQIAAASKGHCTAHAVLGRGAGQRVQAESSLELSHLFILNADPSIAELREQVRFRYGPDDEREHVFDVLAVRTSGARIAYTIKPEARLRSGRFLTEMRVVAWWVREKRFADDLRLTKPVGDRDCYDVDVVARLAAASTGMMSQAQLKAAFGVEIRAYVQAHSMASPPSDGRRCWTLGRGELPPRHPAVRRRPAGVPRAAAGGGGGGRPSASTRR